MKLAKRRRLRTYDVRVILDSGPLSTCPTGEALGLNYLVLTAVDLTAWERIDPRDALRGMAFEVSSHYMLPRR